MPSSRLASIRSQKQGCSSALAIESSNGSLRASCCLLVLLSCRPVVLAVYYILWKRGWGTLRLGGQGLRCLKRKGQCPAVLLSARPTVLPVRERNSKGVFTQPCLCTFDGRGGTFRESYALSCRLAVPLPCCSGVFAAGRPHAERRGLQRCSPPMHRNVDAFRRDDFDVVIPLNNPVVRRKKGGGDTPCTLPSGLLSCCLTVSLSWRGRSKGEGNAATRDERA